MFSPQAGIVTTSSFSQLSRNNAPIITADEIKKKDTYS